MVLHRVGQSVICLRPLGGKASVFCGPHPIPPHPPSHMTGAAALARGAGWKTGDRIAVGQRLELIEGRAGEGQGAALRGGSVTAGLSSCAAFCQG